LPPHGMLSLARVLAEHADAFADEADL
jgi:hypothetical protein